MVCPGSAFEVLPNPGPAFKPLVTPPLDLVGVEVARFSSLIAATATQSAGKRPLRSFSDPPHLLNAGLWFRHGRLAMVSPRLQHHAAVARKSTYPVGSDFWNHLSFRALDVADYTQLMLDFRYIPETMI
jgi:hypothetical protein